MAPADFRNRLVLALTLLAVPGNAWCLVSHVCMAGHMQHPPYGVLNWAAESGWIACWVGAAVFSLKSTLPGRFLLQCGLVILLLSRLVLGSLGGLLFVVEGPLVLVLFLRSLAGLRSGDRRPAGPGAAPSPVSAPTADPDATATR